MRLTRVHVALTAKQLKTLDKLVDKLLLDRTNVLRLALSRLAAEENIKV